MACLSFWIEIKKLPLSKKAYPTNAWSAWVKSEYFYRISLKLFRDLPRMRPTAGTWAVDVCVFQNCFSTSRWCSLLKTKSKKAKTKPAKRPHSTGRAILAWDCGWMGVCSNADNAGTWPSVLFPKPKAGTHWPSHILCKCNNFVVDYLISWKTVSTI